MLKHNLRASCRRSHLYTALLDKSIVTPARPFTDVSAEGGRRPGVHAGLGGSGHL